MRSSHTQATYNNAPLIARFETFLKNIHTIRSTMPATEQAKQVMLEYEQVLIAIQQDKQKTEHLKQVLSALATYLANIITPVNVLISSFADQTSFMLKSSKPYLDHHAENSASDKYYLTVIWFAIDLLLSAHNKQSHATFVNRLTDAKRALSVFLEKQKNPRDHATLFTQFLATKVLFPYTILSDDLSSRSNTADILNRPAFEEACKKYLALLENAEHPLNIHEQCLRYSLLIYRHNVSYSFKMAALKKNRNHTTALEYEAFPIILKILNDDFFKFLADYYDLHQTELKQPTNHLDHENYLLGELINEVIVVLFDIDSRAINRVNEKNLEPAFEDPSHPHWNELLDIVEFRINVLTLLNKFLSCPVTQHLTMSGIDCSKLHSDFQSHLDVILSQKNSMLAKKASISAVALETEQNPRQKKREKSKINQQNKKSLPVNTGKNKSSNKLAATPAESATTATMPPIATPISIEVDTSQTTPSDTLSTPAPEGAAIKETISASIPYTMELPDYVTQLIECLHGTGYVVYVVGGAVCDSLNSIEINEFDLVTTAPIIKLRELFDNMGKLIGARHPYFELSAFEKMVRISPMVTTQRTAFTETVTTENDSLLHILYRTDNLAEDAMRRSFTCNAFYYDRQNQCIHDPLNGYADFHENKLIVPINSLQSMLRDNPFLVLQAIYLIVRLGLKLDASHEKIMQDHAIMINSNPKRLMVEIAKLQTATLKEAAHESLSHFNICIPPATSAAGLQSLSLFHCAPSENIRETTAKNMSPPANIAHGVS